MAGSATVQRDLSARRIIGFACNQAFMFFALFGTSTGDVLFGRFGFVCMLAFMVLGFAVVRAVGAERLPRLFARPLLYIYAVVAAAGLLFAVFPDLGTAGVVAQGVLVGVSSALLLTAWGRAFGRRATRVSVPEVFLGSLVGALVCLVFSFAAMSPVAMGAVCLLPLASVVNIDVGSCDEEEHPVAPANAASEGQANALSAKVLAGTLLFGVAAGLMLMRQNPSIGSVFSASQVGIILYGAFLIGALSLLLSDGFGRGAALNKSYRLAVFVMVVGVLLVPWPLLAESALPGEAVVMAGFLGLEAVLISLFLVLAEITGSDCALSFSMGFSALFAGELVGALVGALVMVAAPDSWASYGVVVLAGVITLLAYVFLFTERDFDALSQLVTESDSFEDTCADIADRFGLSNRETEILAFALRGRTSERIAQELVISKSTVDTHLRRIYSKCGVHSRQELLDLAQM